MFCDDKILKSRLEDSIAIYEFKDFNSSIE